MLTGYRLMWMTVMFDLPVVEAEERRAATRFRNSLLDLGFQMCQYSVYMRFCTSGTQVETYCNMVEQALPRMRERVTLWLAEEQAHAPNSTLAVQLHAVAMRSYNEMALWRLDSAGPEHDKRQQRALSHPRACSAHLNNTSLMDDLLQVWQWVPLTERAAFLDAEASLLQRWGMARERSAQRPATTVDEAAWQAIDEAARTGAALPLALPPALSWYLFDEVSNAATRRPASIVCTLRQWSLQSQLRASGGVLSDAQWWAHRFARMPDALTWRGRDANAMRGDSKYPELARRLDVEGTVRVAVTLDAQGRVVRTAVVGRDIRAAGIREQLPLAFETLLDEAAVASAAAVKTTKPEPEQLKDGHYTGTITLSFKIQ